MASKKPRFKKTSKSQKSKIGVFLFFGQMLQYGALSTNYPDPGQIILNFIF